MKTIRRLSLIGALPVALVSFLPSLVGDRSVASISAFRNWGIQNTLMNSHINVVDAWKLEEGDRNIVVAVIDTGIDPNHPDIKQNLWRDPKTSYYGWDFVLNKPNPIDEHGHGTHVAGILGAALNTRAGTSGVAHHVSIMPVRYYSDRNSGAQNMRNSIAALNWAIDHGAKIINYSGGGPEASPEEFAALKRARDRKILLVAAAGNEYHNSDLPENLYYPCAYRLENIICVAATNIRNQLLPSSNWGKTHVDVAAPGDNILSTVPNGLYSYMSGTSQATAFVTGLAALLLSKQNSLTPAQIREIIRNSSDALPSLRNRVASSGKVNALAALHYLDRYYQPPTLSKSQLAIHSSPMARQKSAPQRPFVKPVRDLKKRPAARPFGKPPQSGGMTTVSFH